MTAPLFQHDGDIYTPTDLAHGPWARGFLHGGPVCGLAAHAAEQAQPHPDLRPARLVVDIHRAVPAEPLEVSSVCARSARRMALVNVTLRANGREVTRASALFLKPTDATPNPPIGRVISRLEGPAGLPTTPMIPPEAVDLVPPGFHRHVEVRWAPRDETEPPAAWFRMPMPLLSESPTSPFVRAATLSDLGNAVAGLARRAAKQDSVAYINPDTTLYLHRVPQGEWLGLELDTSGEADGIGLSHIRLHDSEGPFGHTLSARLFNPITR